jgi:phosphoserine aminotransferase
MSPSAARPASQPGPPDQPSSPDARLYNLCAGPSVFPDEVLQQIREDLWNYRGTGLGIMEISHRGPAFDELLADTQAAIRRLAKIPDDYSILFMTGGSTAQNFLVPLNMLPPGGTADYIETGYWSQRSVEDCRQAGYAPHRAFSGRDTQFRRIPADSELRFSSRPGYVHYTSNNTIYGTQFHRIPRVPEGVPLVCDACSDIFSRPIDISRYDLVYASAQKNLGVTGVTLVIARNEFIERGRTDIPRMLQYRTFAREESPPNTPPHFSIYTVNLMVHWILRQGGLEAMAARNAEKARILYDALDASGFYRPHADRTGPDAVWGSRSLMNVVFRLPTEQLDDLFVREARQAGFDQLRGHRATGGVRASIYNAFPKDGCTEFARFLVDFERRHA